MLMTKKNTNIEDNNEEYISLDARAKPLIELLQAAIKEDEYVVWDKTWD